LYLLQASWKRLLIDAAPLSGGNRETHAPVIPLDYLDALRATEVGRIAAHLPPASRILEIGAGTGRQALELQGLGFDVAAVELSRSDDGPTRVFPIIGYDGVHLPFPDASFDAVFSSNALEHVRDLSCMHAEIKRVMKQGAVCVHVMPTAVWRFWTSLGAFPSAFVQLGQGNWRGALRQSAVALLQPPHGERGHALSELWTFRAAWWRRHFRDHGFVVVRAEPMGLFYTGNVLFGLRLGFAGRARLARVLGSACYLFELKRAQS
jgi:SAM-dependent methyltransferase